MLVPKLRGLNQFFSPGKVSRGGCWHLPGESKRGPSSGCCPACGAANRGQIRPGPFSTAVAEAGVGAGLSGPPGECGGAGADGEREGEEAAGEGARKGKHSCRELLVVSEAGGQAGWQFPCYQELPAGKPHTTQGKEKQASCPSLARIDRHPL